MAACRYGISLLVFNSTSHSFTALTREPSSERLEEKFHIYARPGMFYSLCKLYFRLAPTISQKNPQYSS